jgi:hypothetical protein
MSWLSRTWGRIFSGPKHPKAFLPYIHGAINGIRGLGYPAPNRRSTRWLLVPGRHMVSFGESDWAFDFRGRLVLGLCWWGTPIKIELGSDGHGRYNRHTALHEAGHAIRMQSGDFGHHPAFRAIFQGWSDTGHRLPALDSNEDAERLCVVDYADGGSAIVILTDDEIGQLREAWHETDNTGDY